MSKVKDIKLFAKYVRGELIEKSKLQDELSSSPANEHLKERRLGRVEGLDMAINSLDSWVDFYAFSHEPTEITEEN